ncbi:MAG: CpXC domain-containing protein [Promethearchaeota archaeon]
MTRLISTEVNCPHCKISFKITWEASINTWLDPELIQKVIDDKYYYSCPQCQKQIHLVTKILINCPKGMFFISNDEDIEIKKRILREYNVIDEEEQILTPIMGVNLPAKDHPALNSGFGKEVENFINELLDKKKN